MAIYKKTYRAYTGPLTADWRRVLVTPRFALDEMRRSRFLSLFFLGTMIYPAICALIIYVQQSAAVLAFIRMEGGNDLIAVNSRFFLNFLGVQSMFAFFLTAFIGPGLIAPDLAHNGLPLYLARPFSRNEYLVSKMVVLAGLLSVMTWVPGLLLFALHANLVGWHWAAANAHVAFALLAGAWIWILVLSLLALALSAWVKWKPIAGALLFGVFFVAAGFSVAVNGVLRTKWGSLLNISHLIGSVWLSLFDEPLRRGDGAVFFRVAPAGEIPTVFCWAALLAICGLSYSLLAKKIRGVEVAR
jgi:ABC-2 type transport system permease protein